MRKLSYFYFLQLPTLEISFFLYIIIIFFNFILFLNFT